MISKNKKSHEYELWSGSVMTKFKNLKTVNKVRLKRGPENKDTIRIPYSGWHFTYMGGVDKVITKLESFAHTEFNYSEFKSKNRIQEIIKKGEDLFNPQVYNDHLKDETLLPSHLIQNKTKYHHLFC